MPVGSRGRSWPSMKPTGTIPYRFAALSSRPRPVPGFFVLEDDAVEARECVPHVRFVVDRQQAPPGGVDIRERGVGQLRSVACVQLSHEPS